MTKENAYMSNRNAARSFRAYLDEAKEEFQYEVYCTQDILSTDITQKIVNALSSYGILLVSPKGIRMKPPDKAKQDLWHGGLYLLEITMSNPMDADSMIELLALNTNINSKCFSILPKGDNNIDPFMAPPALAPSDASQEEVGQKRVDTLMTDLMKELSEGAKEEESGNYVTNHRIVSKMLGKEMLKGYYLVEKEDEAGTITGPYETCPDNYDFSMSDNSLASVIETKAFGEKLREMKVEFYPAEMIEDPDDGGERMELEMMTVKVQDQVSGEQYEVPVKASDKQMANKKAIDALLGRFKGDRRRFRVLESKIIN